MNCYEHTFITKQNLTESQNKKLVEKYEEIIKKNSGKIVKSEDWGFKVFSTVIKGNKKGFYYHFKFEGSGKTIDELEKAENIDDNLLRFLSVKVKKHQLEVNFFEKKKIDE